MHYAACMAHARLAKSVAAQALPLLFRTPAVAAPLLLRAHLRRRVLIVAAARAHRDAFVTQFLRGDGGVFRCPFSCVSACGLRRFRQPISWFSRRGAPRQRSGGGCVSGQHGWLCQCARAHYAAHRRRSSTAAVSASIKGALKLSVSSTAKQPTGPVAKCNGGRAMDF